MSVLFEGKPVGTPDAGAFWKIISDYKVKSLFTAPTAFRAIKKEDPEGKFFSKYDLGSFEKIPTGIRPRVYLISRKILPLHLKLKKFSIAK